MGVGVDIVRRSVSGPACVSDAERPFRCAPFHVVQQIVDFAFLPVVLKLASLVDDGDAGTVIPAVFEALQPFYKQRKSVLLPHITDDSTHASNLSLWHCLSGHWDHVTTNWAGVSERGVSKTTCSKATEDSSE